MTVFQPRIVIAWFAAFFTLFFAFFLLGFYIPALLTVVVFGAVFFAAYHLYMSLPGRASENEEFMRQLRARLEERWSRHPSAVRSMDYYLMRAPFDLRASLVFLGLIVVFLCACAALSIWGKHLLLR